MKGKLVNSYIAPLSVICVQYEGHLRLFTCCAPHHSVHIYTSLSYFFSNICFIYTYTYKRKPLHCLFWKLEIEFLNQTYLSKYLSISDSETCFGITSSRSFNTYQIHNDPWSFLVRAFRDFTNSRTDFHVILASIIFETDTIILRISRSITYFNFIKIWNSWN